MVRHRIGPPAKLSHALDEGRFLWLFCLHCGHADRRHPKHLIYLLADDLTFVDVGKRLRCVRCGQRGGGLVFLSPKALPSR